MIILKFFKNYNSFWNWIKWPDLIDPKIVQKKKLALEKYIAKSSAKPINVFKISTATGAGVDEVLRYLYQKISKHHERK